MRRPHALALAGGLSALAAIALLAGAERTPAPRGSFAEAAPAVAAGLADSAQPQGSQHEAGASRAASSRDEQAAPEAPLAGRAARDEKPGDEARPPVEGERWLLGAMLARAVSAPLPEADRVRLADLLIEARELRGREAPGREREILLALAAEFERIAGEPMGSVASRLALPGELAAQPPPAPAGPGTPR